MGSWYLLHFVGKNSLPSPHSPSALPLSLCLFQKAKKSDVSIQGTILRVELSFSDHDRNPGFVSTSLLITILEVLLIHIKNFSTGKSAGI